MHVCLINQSYPLLCNVYIYIKLVISLINTVDLISLINIALWRKDESIILIYIYIKLLSPHHHVSIHKLYIST